MSPDERNDPSPLPPSAPSPAAPPQTGANAAKVRSPARAARSSRPTPRPVTDAPSVRVDRTSWI